MTYEDQQQLHSAIARMKRLMDESGHAIADGKPELAAEYLQQIRDSTMSLLEELGSLYYTHA